MARATSKTVVFSLVISYFDRVLLRALGLQEVAKLKLAEEKKARNVKGMPFIVADVTGQEFRRVKRANGVVTSVEENIYCDGG